MRHTTDDIYPTADSIAKAKAAQQAQRAEVSAQTGLVFTRDGRPQFSPAVIVVCPKCRFEASARSEGRAINAIAAHLIKCHSVPVPVPASEAA